MKKSFCILLTMALGLTAAGCLAPASQEAAGEPDLVITDIHKVKTPAGFLIGYTVKNQGGADAGASTSVLYANEEVKASDTVPPLAEGDSVAREFSGWVYSPLTPVIKVVADTDNNVVESDEDNNEEQISIGVEVVFDFIDEAPNALWQSGPPIATIGFGGSDLDGFARYLTGQRLEDGSVPLQTLESHPKPASGGWITGTYTQLYSEDYTIEPGEHFFARVGFLEGAIGSSVRFSVMLRPEGGPNTWIANVTKIYGTPLQTIDVPLNAFAGKQAEFLLRVETDGSVIQDGALWPEARIIR